jgi:hypothetical protein
VIGEAGGRVVYNRALVDFARHYGFQPKACACHYATNRSPLSKIVDISFVLWEPIFLTAEIAEGYAAVQGPGSCKSAFGIPALLRNRVWRQRKRGVETCANSLSLGSCSLGRQRAMLAHYDQYAPT